MALYDSLTGDSIVNGCLATISYAEYGKDARAAMAAAIERCFQLAVVRAGGTQHGVTHSDIAWYAGRVRSEIYGEEVRSAFRTGLLLAYQAAGVQPSGTASSYFDWMIHAQTGENLKNDIIMCISLCCQEVSR